MEALSVREYRNNLAASFTKADNGEQASVVELSLVILIYWRNIIISA